LAVKASSWLKGLFRILGQVCAILAITLALDYILLATVFSGWKRSRDDAATAYTQAYVLAPVITTSHRIRTPCDRGAGSSIPFAPTVMVSGPAPGEGDKSKPAIFVIGDSFTEALRVPYEESFAGLMACEVAREGKAVWNLGVMSFSPVIYHRKIRAAGEKLGIRPTKIYVLLDLSDITDDAIVYRVGEDGTIRMAPSHHWFDTGQFLLGNFATFRLLYNLWLDMPFGSAAPDESWRALEPRSQDHGRLGPPRVGAGRQEHGRDRRDLPGVDVPTHPGRLPWPDNVRAGDRNSIQVTHWRQRPTERGVRFVNGFAPFFQKPPDIAVGRYFIPGDVHFSAQGRRLRFEELKRSVGVF